MSKYHQDLIHELEPTVNPVGIKASMRLQYGTLDHLSRETFVEEIRLTKLSEAHQPGFLKQAVEYCSLEKEYPEWENRTQKPEPTTFEGERITKRLQLLTTITRIRSLELW